ncbi:MAG: serine hydrolase domain-containing protein [Planctomycetota bacterium]|jgi:D-alanyl-D-alanine carboxypeptidase
MRSIPARLPFPAIIHVALLPLAFTSGCAGETENEHARIFQQQVETAARDSGIPGLVIALREPDGRVFIGAVGTADLSEDTPMRVDSRFYIGSMSQSMLAAVVFMLEEEGKLKLEDPISRYLEFPGAESVSVEMLLDHSTGFADWTGMDLRAADNPRLPELLLSPQNTESLIIIAAEAEPVFESGTKQEGCYTNLLLLSRLIEQITGKPASAVFEERIFDPLGMKDTLYLQPGETLEPLSHGYRAEDGWGERLEEGLTDVSRADENLRALADMGIISTAQDVLKFHVGLRNGGLISPDSWEKMRRVRPGKFNGLGYQISKGRRGTWEGNNGHAVGHLSCSYFHVEKGVYLVMMGNLGDTSLPMTALWDLRYGDSPGEPGGPP